MKNNILALIFPVVLSMQQPEAAAPSRGLLIDEFKSSAQLQVSSTAFASGAGIPRPYSAYGENFSPALSWQGVPPSTQSLALVVEDPDAKSPAPSPFVHWTLYALAPSQTTLDESIPAIPRLPTVASAQQGRNSRGTVGYFGPRPPSGDGVHHYHFEVFALDSRLDLPPAASVDQLVAALKGHVIAAGEIVGTFSTP